MEHGLPMSCSILTIMPYLCATFGPDPLASSLSPAKPVFEMRSARPQAVRLRLSGWRPAYIPAVLCATASPLAPYLSGEDFTPKEHQGL